MEWFYIITMFILCLIVIRLNNKLLKEREKQTTLLSQFELYKALYNGDEVIEIVNMIQEQINERLKSNGGEIDDAIRELENLKIDIIELFSPMSAGGIKKEL